jgi:hypothetical protein
MSKGRRGIPAKLPILGPPGLGHGKARNCFDAVRMTAAGVIEQSA